MKQTPAHHDFNADLLALIPDGCRRLIEVGCSTGAVARAYKQANPECFYIGIEIDPDYGDLARQWCDQVIVGNIETMADSELDGLGSFDCLLFGDVLEHLMDPWRLLRRLRGRMSADSRIAACIPNMQHWSIQARLSIGDLIYEDNGLLDRTHIRWFSRQTIGQLFTGAGFAIEAGVSRSINDPEAQRFLPHIRQMALAAGADADQAVADAMVYQYVLRARPA
jgi:2-polyprenyl-3-methyl-5-hydroxy-6-metoxy-1,4-benzoquinol methylase